MAIWKHRWSKRGGDLIGNLGHVGQRLSALERQEEKEDEKEIPQAVSRFWRDYKRLIHFLWVSLFVCFMGTLILRSPGQVKIGMLLFLSVIAQLVLIGLLTFVRAMVVIVRFHEARWTDKQGGR